MLQPSEFLLVLGVALTTALVALLVIHGRRRAVGEPQVVVPEPLALLFDHGVLHHASQAALSRFALLPGAHAWEDLREALVARFPDFPAEAGSSTLGQMTMTPADPADTGRVEITWRDGLSWVAVHEGDGPELPAAGAGQGMEKLCCETMPYPAWEVRANGSIGWRNEAYVSLVKEFAKAPAEKLFELPYGAETARLSLSDSEGALHWFEVTTHRVDGRTLCHACRVTRLVVSETAQRQFVQTLSKTFAHLSIGLAIFDRDGRLGIFNPALIDLTGLKPGFLVTQPSTMSFFDALRENRGMPEPKNYASWRQEIVELIDAASDGQYRETWSLEDGRTFSVQGRPHPDGATAFLIEDITPEITLTRSFRTEIAQYEALLDTVKDAMVVFSPSGVITFCNEAYRQMWGQDPETAFADVTVHDATKVWMSRVAEGTEWAGLIDFVTTLGPREGYEMALDLRDGGSLACDLVPIAPNATMVRFSERGAARVLTEGPDVEAV